MVQRFSVVPVCLFEFFIEHLKADDSLEVFLEDFPSVSRERANKLLEQALHQLTLNNEVAA